MIGFSSFAAGIVLLFGPPIAIALEVNFEPADQIFVQATQQYEEIWLNDGERIVSVMERLSGLKFEEGPIQAIIVERRSFSGYKAIPMRLRASYAPDTKRATLVHELGHRLLSGITTKNFEDHPALFLFLYDAWVELWGQDLADAEVIVESNRRGIYDYEGAWQTALSTSASERAAEFSKIRSRLELEKSQ